MADNRERAAVIERVYDGDTVFLTVDMLLFKMADVSCRLAGLNTREIGTPGAGEARDFLMTLLPPARRVVVRIIRLDKYAGRFDGVIVAGAVNVNDEMVRQGWAAPWDGSGAAPLPAWPRVVATGLRASPHWKGVDV
jgi:endonuclease YncB( thermonuclease family)